MKNVTKVFYDSPLDIMKIILPIGFCSEKIKQGYAHLIEHLLIRGNYNLLKKVEAEGGWFNGTTREDAVEIDIYIATKEGGGAIEKLENGLKLTVKDILKNEFEEEINVIKKEYRTLIVKNNPTGIEKRIGNLAQIDEFNIIEANNILEGMCDQIRVLMLSNRYPKFRDLEEPFDINVNLKKDKCVIGGNNRYSIYVLKVLALAFKENGYSEGVDFSEDSLIISKRICADIELRSKAIGDRFYILSKLSFSKYNTYMSLLGNNWNYFYDFDICKYWGRIYEKINCIS